MFHSQGDRPDDRRGRDCSTARPCARNQVARISNYTGPECISVRSRVVRLIAIIGNQVAHNQVARMGDF